MIAQRTGLAPRRERQCWRLDQGQERSGILPRRLTRQCGASVVTVRETVTTRTEDSDETHRHTGPRAHEEANATVTQTGCTEADGASRRGFSDTPRELEAGQGHRDASTAAGSNHCGDHEGNGMAAPLGARLLCRR